MYDLFCWLAYRFGDAFSGLEVAAADRARCAELIGESIRQLGPLSTQTRGGEGEAVGPAGAAVAEAARLAALLAWSRSGSGGAWWQGGAAGNGAGSYGWGRSGEVRGSGGSSKWGGGSSSESGSESDGEWAEQRWRQRKGGYAKRRRR